MLLSEYFKSKGNTTFKYIGTVIGNIEMSQKGKAWAKILVEMDADAPITDTHPAYGGHRESGEWYLESNKIGWVATEPGDQEICFIEV